MHKKKYIILSFVLVGTLFACNVPNPEAEGKIADNMHKSTKRGAAFSFGNTDDLILLSPYISWDYNWGNTQGDIAGYWFDSNEIDFCPMCWSASYNATNIRNYVAAHPSTKYLLAFNEPNLKDQANMTPKRAAELWQPVVALAKELNLKLVSPAMNYGTLEGYHDPVKWLDEFFACDGVSIDDISAISLHCYQVGTGGIQTMVESMAKYNKPVWVTEFCAWEPGVGPGSAEEQMKYMSEVINYMETATAVERYAWFMPRTKDATDAYPYNQLLTKTKPYDLTPLGRVYCGLSSFDKSVWLTTVNPIQAKDYVAISDKDIHVLPSTDDANLLMLNAFHAEQWTEYQVYVPEAVITLQIRYATMLTPTVRIYVDGKETCTTTLAATGKNMTTWGTADIPLQIKAGKHTVRIEGIEGTWHFAWWRLL